jgi:hypothetical protein
LRIVLPLGALNEVFDDIAAGRHWLWVLAGALSIIAIYLIPVPVKETEPGW